MSRAYLAKEAPQTSHPCGLCFFADADATAGDDIDATFESPSLLACSRPSHSEVGDRAEAFEATDVAKDEARV